LKDRASALGEYIHALQGRSARSDDGFSLALQMCHRYTDVIQRELDISVNSQRDDKGRQDKVRTVAREFFEKERWIDQRFARGAQGDVPRALKTMARREFKRHGLDNQEPVLTVGAPDNFEAYTPDLSRFLFGNNLYEESYRMGLPPAMPRLSIISVPYIEGTRTLLYPITLGHEIGHLRIEDEGREQIVDLTRDWFDESEAEVIGRGTADEHEAERVVTGDEPERRHQRRPSDSDDDESLSARLGPARRIRTILENWVEEILCDLNAVRLFGPAGLNAISEFLAGLPRSHDPRTRWLTHPPLQVRIQVMLRFLQRTGQAAEVGPAAAWSGYLNVAAPPLPAEETFVAKCFEDEINTEPLFAHALSWGDPYLAHKRSAEIEWVTNQLLDGLPGGTHCPASASASDVVSAADVANAAWIARNALEDSEAQSRSGVLVAASSTDLPTPQKRLIVDRLASKAIDSIEFTRLWRSTAERIEDIRDLKPNEPQPRTTGGGILSSSAIIRRLMATEPEMRLVVTPLLKASIQDAGVDLRLAPDFIVFRHSATGAFDALDKGQDPRMLQEAVEKGWGVPFILHPGELVLAATLEYIAVPDDVAAHVVTRSSYGRLGLITATAVQVQPGSRGCITLELVNHGDTPIALTPGARIGQLVFFTVEDPVPAATDKKYRFPIGPEFSKVAADSDGAGLTLIKQAASMLDRVERFGIDSNVARVSFEASLPASDGADFEEIAEREGLETAIAREGEIEPRSVGDILHLVEHGGSVGTLQVAGRGRMTTFSLAVVRYCLSAGRRLEMEFDRDGTVQIRHMLTQNECDILVSLPQFDENGEKTREPPEIQLIMVNALEDARRLTSALAFLGRRRVGPPDH
jgi:deoxycytidine triphosphate deaminase